MDEQNNMNQVPVEQTPMTQNQEAAPAPQPQMGASATEMPIMNEGTVEYASFLSRFLAGLIDAVLLMIVAIPIGMVFSSGNVENAYTANPLGNLIWAVYSVFMINKYGATLGKMALGIRVQNQTTGANLTIVEAILREVVGKFLSGMVFLLGYLWMLWDPNKQTWHDKIAKSIVVRKK